MAKQEIKFAVFSDLHYKKGMYIASVSDLEAILARANENKVDFVIHCGDMCNDYVHSRELTDTYLANPYGLPVYGLYGNHELESAGNCMPTVTPLLNNREVTWGTLGGKMGDGTIAYYYFDVNGFRIICTDTNYSWNSELLQWEHNRPASWGPPNEQAPFNCLGPAQLAWLERTLWDAAAQGLKCLVFSHADFSGLWKSCPDYETVQTLFRAVNEKYPKTVLAAINGHWHSNRRAVIDNVVYWDTNTVRNGVWLPTKEPHYTEDQTFLYVDYDENGKEIDRRIRPLTDLWMSKQTWFYADPLSVIVTVTTDGYLKFDGVQSSWYADVVPENVAHNVDPQITTAEYQL